MTLYFRALMDIDRSCENSITPRYIARPERAVLSMEGQSTAFLASGILSDCLSDGVNENVLLTTPCCHRTEAALLLERSKSKGPLNRRELFLVVAKRLLVEAVHLHILRFLVVSAWGID